MRIAKWLLLTVTALILTLVASVPFAVPALAAYACPSCYGFETVRPGLFIEAGIATPDRESVAAIVDSGRQRVREFYGRFNRTPLLLVCLSEACFRKMGGKGARAEMYGSAFIVVSPRGINETIIAHELSHIELHSRIGVVALLSGRLPAWIDEGTAVIASEDERYLLPASSAHDRCRVEPGTENRIGFFGWGTEAGRTPTLYAQAACRVLRLIAAKGGRVRFLEYVNELAEGRGQNLQ